MPELFNWNNIRQPSTTYDLETKPDAINIDFKDGESIWIEREHGRILVHCYNPAQDKPVNVEIFQHKTEVWTDA